MSDFSAGRPSARRASAQRPGHDGSPPPVLLGALAAAGLIAVIIIALIASMGLSGDGSVRAGAAGGGAASAGAQQRLLLRVSIEGDGRGSVRMSPGGVTCRSSCEHAFAGGARIAATAHAADGATFVGWGDSCDGAADCAFEMDEGRSLEATFSKTRADDSDALDSGDDPATPAASDDDEAAPDDLDEQLDGLDDDADLDELDDPAVASGDCLDGRDNDSDGLTDTAQDPNCLDGTTEAGTPQPPPRTSTPPAPEECSDKRDNDGDGLIDNAQDPGCEGKSTEAG